MKSNEWIHLLNYHVDSTFLAKTSLLQLDVMHFSIEQFSTNDLSSGSGPSLRTSQHFATSMLN